MTTDRSVELIERTRPHDGYFKLDRYILRHSQFKGGMGEPVSREILERGHAACVIPYDPARDEIVLIEQFRPGCYAAGDPDPWMVEVVAGIIDPGETAETVCARESVEEAGIEIGTPVLLGTIYMSPGCSSETIALYVAPCDATTAKGVHGLEEEGEDIRVFTAPAEESFAMVCDGRIRNAMTGMALLLFEKKRETLRAGWS